jgi:hypothetical protein
MWTHGNLNIFDSFGLDELRKLHLNKSKKVYFNFNISTNHEKRQQCYDSVISKIPFLPNMNPHNNLVRLSKYEFCICPEGNGVDTHRLWEALYLQSIPIVLKTPFIEILIKTFNLDMVVLESWNDLNISMLNYKNYNFNYDKISFLILTSNYII